MFTRGAALVLALALAAAPLAACGDDDASGSGGAIAVEAGFYPLAWVAEQVGGDAVSVRSLAKAGAEPHDLELTPSDVAHVLDADLVVYLRGFQPAVDDAADQAGADRRFDAAAEGADLDLREQDAVDPHFWLDPTRLAAVGDALAERFAALAPEHRDAFLGRAEALSERLGTLDRQLEAGLADCDRRDLVTSHAAFGYLARRYDLRQVGITGLTPEQEPSPSDLAAVADFAEEHDVRTIFFESLVSPAIAEAVADEVGATTDVLDPLEGIDDSSRGEDYLEVMSANLAALRTALGCR